MGVRGVSGGLSFGFAMACSISGRGLTFRSVSVGMGVTNVGCRLSGGSNSCFKLLTNCVRGRPSGPISSSTLNVCTGSKGLINCVPGSRVTGIGGFARNRVVPYFLRVTPFISGRNGITVRKATILLGLCRKGRSVVRGMVGSCAIDLKRTSGRRLNRLGNGLSGAGCGRCMRGNRNLLSRFKFGVLPCRVLPSDRGAGS